MKNVIRRRPSAAMIVAVIALVMAMAGGAFAGSKFLPSKKFKKLKRVAVTRLTYVNNTQTVGQSNGSNTDAKIVSADCPSGYHPVGGGVRLSPQNDSLWWDDGYLTPTGYAAKVFNYTGTNRTALVTVACVTANATGSPSA